MPTSTSYRRCLPALALVAGLATGCAGQQTASNGFVPQTAMPKGVPLMSDATQLDGLVQPDSKIHIFTVNRENGGSVVAFLKSASGDVAPARKIAGPRTTLTDPDALALDASGNIYAANDGGTRVAVFANDANGNRKPLRMIGGSKSHLGPTEGLMVAPSGSLWASSYSNNTLAEYAAGAKGNVAPIHTIAGSKTELDSPVGMAMDSSDRLFVANTDSASILVYKNGSNGNVAPVMSISGSNTGLGRPFALAFDSNGRLLVADEFVGVLVFAKGASGDVAPVAKITGFGYADGVVADAQDHIYVADFNGNSIKEFASNADGNATPMRTIEGFKTGLNGANYLALH